MKSDICYTNHPHDVVEVCLLDELPDAIYLIDPLTSDILYVNNAGCDSLGMTREEVLFQSVMSLQEDVVNMPQWCEIAQVITDSDEPYLFLGRHKRKDGSVFPVEVRTSNVKKGDKHYFLSVARDITCRAIIDEELKGHQHSLWYALNEATDGIWEWNIQTGHLYVSPKLKQMRGYGPQEPVDKVNFWESSIHPDDFDRVIQLLEEHLKGKLDRYEARYRMQTRAGHYIWVHDKGKVSEFDSQGKPLVAVGMVQNVTEQVHLQQRLENQASRDDLTGAFNRRVCQESIEHQIGASRTDGSHFTIILLDIDHFKKVNDEYGHAAGDMVLKSFVSKTSALIRSEDTLFRWGGEEFLILMPHMDHKAAMVRAEELRQSIADTLLPLAEGVSKTLTVSMGVATFPEHGEQMGQLVQSADIAMYRAKAKGRNRVEVLRQG